MKGLLKLITCLAPVADDIPDTLADATARAACSGATLPAVKHEFNKLGFNDLGFN